MKIKKNGDGVVKLRTSDTRTTCHNRATITKREHFLKSPRILRSQWYVKFTLHNQCTGRVLFAFYLLRKVRKTFHFLFLIRKMVNFVDNFT